MVSQVRGVSSALPEDVREAEAPGSLSPWQVMVRRLARQRLAVASLLVLFLLGGVALFAELIAPYGPHERHQELHYAPPQSLHFDLARGLHTYALERRVDPVTFEEQYVELQGEPLAVRFFQPGEPYRLWGLIPLQRHLFSVSREGAARGGHAEATFFLLGADAAGRDVFSRCVYGARGSLSLGLLGLAVALVLGALFGGVAGAVGGRTGLLQRAIDVVSALPPLPLWLALAALLPAHWTARGVYFALALLLGLLGWAGLARVVRSNLLALRDEEYAVAARLLGASRARVLLRHLLPAFTSELLVALLLAVPGILLGEAALSFVGLGLRPPSVSWGVMLHDCLDLKAARLHPWLLSPLAFISLLLLSFTFLGDGVRDAAEPHTH